MKEQALRFIAAFFFAAGYQINRRWNEAMKWMLLVLMTVVLAACSGESLSPERKACLDKASTEAERIECNKESAIEADKKAEDADTKADGAD